MDDVIVSCLSIQQTVYQLSLGSEPLAAKSKVKWWHLVNIYYINSTNIIPVLLTGLNQTRSTQRKGITAGEVQPELASSLHEGSTNHIHGCEKK